MHNKYFSNINSFNGFNESQSISNLFNIVSINVRSISSLNKFNKFKSEICGMSVIPEIIAVQETWFDKRCVGLYSIDGYDVIHCCRSDCYGGTSVYISKQIKYNLLFSWSKDFLDLICISLPDVLIDNKPMVITSLYRSQRCSLESFTRMLDTLLLNVQNSPCFFIGDFNINLMCFDNLRRCLMDTFTEYNFVSCHNLVTRPESESCIDCVFSNFLNSISVNSVQSSLSDHNFIFCRIEMSFCHREIIIENKNWIDFSKYGSYIDENLTQANFNGSEQQCENLINTLSLAALQSTEIKTKQINIRQKINPWVSEELSSLISYKNKLVKARRKNKQNKFIANSLKRISKIIKYCNKQLMNNYYSYNIELCKGDPKKTWKFLNKQIGKK